MGKNVIGVAKRKSIHVRLSDALHDDIMRECAKTNKSLTDVVTKRLMRGM